MQINDNTTRNNMADQIDAAVGTTGYARFQNAAQTATYAKVALANPAFDAGGTGGAGVIQLDVSPVPEDTAPSAGTAVRLGIYTAKTAGTLIFTCGIATGGTPDVTMADNTITTTDTVQLTQLDITVPAGTVDTV